MAYNNHSSVVLLLALLLFTAANPFVHGNILNGISITGQLCCTSSGNCPGGPGVNGTNIQVSCNVGSTTINLGSNTTNATGSFNITVPTPRGLLLPQPIPQCILYVRLPLNSTVCPVLSTVNGTLVAGIQSVGTVVTNLLGLVRTAITLQFIRINATGTV